MQGKDVFHRKHPLSYGDLRKPDETIDDHEVFYDGGQYLEAAGSYI
jgi:hypothetical protein